MDYHNELYGNLKQHKIQEALLLTGELLFTKDFELIQKTWIRAIACVGEYTDVCFMKWNECIKDIVDFIRHDNVDICNSLRITTKICILFENTIQYNVIPKTTIPQLRVKTISFFENKLSEKGEDYFLPILPKPINEKEFCIKIIGGVVKLWSDKRHIDFRNALEYVSRKEYMIESIHTETGSSIVAFLWEFMKLYEPSIATNIYIIYKTGFKKKDKTWRNNILYGIHNYLNEIYNTVSWDIREKSLIEKTDVITKEIWKHILQKHNVVEKKNEGDKMTIFERYYPTKLEEYCDEEQEQHYKIEPRLVQLNNSKTNPVKKNEDFYNLKYK
jgi:hypothetical protein